MTTSNGRYDAVTLDMGFTLVELHTGYDKTLLGLAADLGRTATGRPITLEDVHNASRTFWQAWVNEDATRTWEPSEAADEALGREIDRRICAHLGITDPAFADAVSDQARAAFHDPATYTLFPEVMETLAVLRQAVPRLGILSNWGWRLQELCEQLGLAPYFDFIVTSARVGCAKPNPCIFRHMISLAGATPARTLHVGDSLAADVRGAQAVGITGVLLDRAGNAPAGDYPRIRSLTEVLALI